jgi:hypothetical protein
MPNVKRYYETIAHGLTQWDSELKPVMEGTPFMAATINLGPQTITKSHRDAQNLSFGTCCIVVGGCFDYQKGGHLYLEDMHMELEVAAGDVVFIPSACVTHGNRPIQANETRYSFTLYTAGSIFSWVENGNKSTKDLEEAKQKRRQQEGPQRWKNGWELYNH